MKLLIVDDDDIIREAIKKIAVEENLGFDVIEEAENGEEAINKALDIFPDIIVTDIKMPGIDGLSFIEKTYKKLHDAKFIILSGYDDFTFAQKAIKFGICEYLLKPYSREEMIALLKNYINIINTERILKIKNENINKLFNSNIGAFRAKQIVDILTDPASLNKNLVKVINDIYGVNLEGKSYMLLYVDIDNKSYVCRELYQNNKELMVFAVKNIVMELLNESFKSLSFESDKSGVISLLAFEGSKQEFESKLGLTIEKIKYMIKKFLKHSVTICSSKAFSDIQEAGSVYCRLQEVLQLKLFKGYDITLKYSMSDIRNVKFNIEKQDMENTFHSIINCDEMKLNFELEKLFRNISSSNDISALSVKKAVSKLLIYIYNYISMADIKIDNVYGEDISYWNEIIQIEVMQDLKFWLKDFLHSLLEAVKQKKEEYKTKNVVAALSYIKANYSSDFTLEDISESVHLNANYFSELFKKEVGINFVDYVTEVRLEAAKRLLVEGQKKISEIAKEVGFRSPDYFCKVFKKVTGISPKSFR